MENLSAAPENNLYADIVQFLRTEQLLVPKSNDSNKEQRRAGLEELKKRAAAVSEAFPEGWVTECRQDPAGEPKNMFETEISKEFQKYLQQKGLNAYSYAKHVGPVQFNWIECQPPNFADKGRASRKGWRIALGACPPLNFAVAGIRHHHGDDTSQKRLTEVSQNLYQAAEDLLEEETLDGFRPIETSDFDGGNLLPSDVTQVGTLDLNDYPHGASITMVRNTTGKKALATFFILTHLELDDENKFWNTLGDLTKVATMLAQEEK